MQEFFVQRTVRYAATSLHHLPHQALLTGHKSKRIVRIMKIEQEIYSPLRESTNAQRQETGVRSYSLPNKVMPSEIHHNGNYILLIAVYRVYQENATKKYKLIKLT